MGVESRLRSRLRLLEEDIPASGAQRNSQVALQDYPNCFPSDGRVLQPQSVDRERPRRKQAPGSPHDSYHGYFAC